MSKLFSKELEPSVGRELCKLWDKELNGSNSRYSKPSMSGNRRGRQPGPLSTEPHHWNQPSPQSSFTNTQQILTPHAASMPIPVPLPSQHSHNPLMQGGYPHQSRPMVGQAALGYPSHAVGMHPVAPVRYPHNSSVVAGIQVQQQGSTGSGIRRPNTFPS